MQPPSLSSHPITGNTPWSPGPWGLAIPPPLTLTPCSVSHHHWKWLCFARAGANINGEPQRAEESHVESVKDRSHLLGFSSCCLTTNCSPKPQTKHWKGRNRQKPSEPAKTKWTGKNQVLLSSLWKPNNGFVLGHFMSVIWVHIKWEHK